MTEIGIDSLRNLITHFAKNTYRTKDADVTVVVSYMYLANKHADIKLFVKLTDHVFFFTESGDHAEVHAACGL